MFFNEVQAFLVGLRHIPDLLVIDIRRNSSALIGQLSDFVPDFHEACVVMDDIAP